MMDDNLSDKEQVEAFKKWWKTQGKYIAIAIVIGLALGFGWRYWHSMQEKRAENASMIYQSVLQADKQKQSVTVQGGTNILMKDFPSSPYASLAAMIWAKEAVLTKHYGVAIEKLTWVIEHSKEKRFVDMARLSIARILLEQGQSDKALTYLNAINSKHFGPLVDWVKGDLYRQQGNAKLAKQFYQKAKNALTAVPPATALMNMNLAQPISNK